MAPETRFRHTAVVAPLQPGSPLHDAAAAQLADLGVTAAPDSGTLILLWGGYNTLTAEFGGRDIQVPHAFHSELQHAAMLALAITGVDVGLVAAGALGAEACSHRGMAAVDEHWRGALAALPPHR